MRVLPFLKQGAKNLREGMLRPSLPLWVKPLWCPGVVHDDFYFVHCSGPQVHKIKILTETVTIDGFATTKIAPT